MGRCIDDGDPCLHGSKNALEILLACLQALFALPERLFCPPPGHDWPYLVGQFSELNIRVATFLQVKVRAVVDRLDDHLFTPPAR